MKLILRTFFLLLCSYRANAQYSDSMHYYIGANATGSVNNTNDASSYLLNNALKMGIRQKSFSLNSTNNWVYGSQDKILTNNDYNSTLDFNLYKTFPHFYYWGLGNYMASYSLKINSQYQGGAGVAYNVIDKKTANLNISDGILYEHDDIFLRDTVRDVYSTYRNSLRLSFKWTIHDLVTVNGMGFYQNSFSNGNDYVLKGNLGLSVKIQKWLSLTSAFVYNRFNRTDQENTLFTYGLTIDKYF
jgi:hypothetical protein